MPIAVPIEQVDRTVAEILRQVQNARYLAQKAGIATDMKDPVQFQLSVLIPGGLNALPRVQKTIQSGDQVTTQEDPGTVETQVTDKQIENQNSIESGQLVTENGSQQQSGTDNQNQAFGRTTQTDITYEDP